MKNREEILKELREIAPELAKLEKTPAADAPAGYFAEFPSVLMKKIRTEELASELSTVAPQLAKLEKVNTLEAPPADYFKSNPASILSKVQSAKKAQSSPGWIGSLNGFAERIAVLIFKPKYSVAFAGFATMMILAVMLVMKVEEQCVDIECKMAQLSTEEINRYISANADEFKSDLLDYSTEEFAKEVNARALFDFSDEDLSNAVLE